MPARAKNPVGASPWSYVDRVTTPAEWTGKSVEATQEVATVNVTLRCWGSVVAADASGSCTGVSTGGRIKLTADIDRDTGVVSVTRSAQRALLRMEKHRAFVCDENDWCAHTRTTRGRAVSRPAPSSSPTPARRPGR